MRTGVPLWTGPDDILFSTELNSEVTSVYSILMRLSDERGEFLICLYFVGLQPPGACGADAAGGAAIPGQITSSTSISSYVDMKQRYHKLKLSISARSFSHRQLSKKKRQRFWT